MTSSVPSSAAHAAALTRAATARLEPAATRRFPLARPADPRTAGRLPDGRVARLRLHGAFTERGTAELRYRHGATAG